MQKEYKTIAAMISLYCRECHKTQKDLCATCAELLTYVKTRLDKCPYAGNKPTCATCPIHCYKPQQRRQIRQVMRYAGPRMMRSHPILAIRHLAQTLKKPSKVKS